jgi:protein-tyrosine phosphatase
MESLTPPRTLLVDLHCHVLPGVDDGATHEAESLRMLQVAEEEGIGIVAATPHAHHCPAERIPPKVARLNQLAAEAGLTVRVVAGQEVRIAADLVTLYRTGKLATLNGGHYLLLELSLSGPLPTYLHRAIDDLQGLGLCPILAHAERYGDIQRDPGPLRELIARGVPIQVNAGSLTGPAERAARPTAERLLRERLVHLIASDSHDDRWQPPRLRAALARAAELAGTEYAAWMVANAAAVLRDEAITLPEPLPPNHDSMG